MLHCIFGLLDRDFKGTVTVDEFEKLRSFNSATLLQGLQDLKTFIDEKFGGIDECFQKLLNFEKQQKRLPGKAKSVSFSTFEKALTQGGYKHAFADADLEMLFLFLDEASDQSTSGCLTYMEWQLLHGFEARAITGNPARLRRFLEQQFGNMEEAYQQLQTSWQARVIRERLTQAALNGLVRALRNCATDGKSACFRKSDAMGAAKASTMKAFHVAAFFKQRQEASNIKAVGGAADAARRLPLGLASRLSKAGASTHSQAKADVGLQRPHTHQGMRERSSVKEPNLNVKGMGKPPRGIPSMPSSARRPVSRGTTYSLPHKSPALPERLKTELWQPEMSPFFHAEAAAPQSARCRSAPLADQRDFAASRYGVASTTPTGGPRWADKQEFAASRYGVACTTPTGEPRCKFQLVESQPGFTSLHNACSGRTSSQGSNRSSGMSAIHWGMM